MQLNTYLLRRNIYHVLMWISSSLIKCNYLPGHLELTDALQMVGPGCCHAEECKLGELKVQAGGQLVLKNCEVENGTKVESGGQLVLDNCEVKNGTKSGLILMTGMIIRRR